MDKPVVSICVAGIRTEKWMELYNSAAKSVGAYSFEFVFSSPFAMPKEFEGIWNVKYIRDFGNPSRALQLAHYLAEGELVMAAYDDGIFIDNNLELAIKKMLPFKGQKSIMTLICTEGDGWKTGNDPRLTEPEEWYRPKYHGDMKVMDGVKDEWVTAVYYLMFNNDYRTLGGLDCRFEGVNLNIHDLCCRAQRDGYKIIFSEFGRPIQRIEHDPGRGMDSPVVSAYHDNDRPLFSRHYFSPEACEKREKYIQFDNWLEADRVWLRKWKI